MQQRIENFRYLLLQCNINALVWWLVITWSPLGHHLEVKANYSPEVGRGQTRTGRGSFPLVTQTILVLTVLFYIVLYGLSILFN